MKKAILTLVAVLVASVAFAGGEVKKADTKPVLKQNTSAKKAVKAKKVEKKVEAVKVEVKK